MRRMEAATADAGKSSSCALQSQSTFAAKTQDSLHLMPMYRYCSRRFSGTVSFFASIGYRIGFSSWDTSCTVKSCLMRGLLADMQLLQPNVTAFAVLKGIWSRALATQQKRCPFFLTRLSWVKSMKNYGFPQVLIDLVAPWIAFNHEKHGDKLKLVLLFGTEQPDPETKRCASKYFDCWMEYVDVNVCVLSDRLLPVLPDTVTDEDIADISSS